MLGKEDEKLRLPYPSGHFRYDRPREPRFIGIGKTFGGESGMVKESIPQ